MTKSQVTEHVAHFRMTGADFTRIARERLLEDAPGHAWRIASCLGNDDGDDRQTGVSEAALGILMGTKKLTGDERGMKLVKEHAKVTAKYLADVAYVYAGRIKIRDKWYRPIAYVSDMGPRDMRNDHGMPVNRIGRGFNTGYSNRAWHYCGPDEIVVDAASYPDPNRGNRSVKGLKREVIFRTCGERPHWHEVPLSGQAALEEFLAAGHRLEERSHTALYGTTADEIWEGAPDDKVDIGAKAIHVGAERANRERAALKKGDVGPMNARLNAELELARELDEDDRPEVQALRDDPQKGAVAEFTKLIAENPDEALRVFDDHLKRDEMIERAWEQGPGVGTMAELLDEHDPEALAKFVPRTSYEHEADRLRRDYRLAQEIIDPQAREDAEDQIEAEREVLRKRRLGDLQTAILKQANGDLLDLSWEAVLRDDGEVRVPAGSVKVPRAPFLHWAFARMRMFADQLPPWNNVSPIGMKMMNDDPNHTDWIIGAGLDPEDRELLYYPGPVADAAMKLSHALQDRFDEPSDVHVLVDGPIVSGTVVHGKRNKPTPPGSIVVLPDLRPQYLEAIAEAAGVITENGGETAHLAQVGREQNLPIVRVANAREKYEEGSEVMINTGTRTVMGL